MFFDWKGILVLYIFSCLYTVHQSINLKTPRKNLAWPLKTILLLEYPIRNTLTVGAFTLAFERNRQQKECFVLQRVHLCIMCLYTSGKWLLGIIYPDSSLLWVIIPEGIYECIHLYYTLMNEAFSFFQVAGYVNSCLNLSLFPVRGVFQETGVRGRLKVEGKGRVNKKREREKAHMGWIRRPPPACAGSSGWCLSDLGERLEPSAYPWTWHKPLYLHTNTNLLQKSQEWPY